jgi:hypothetical protein
MQAHFHITFELNGENYSIFFLSRLPNIMVDIPLFPPLCLVIEVGLTTIW